MILARTPSVVPVAAVVEESTVISQDYTTHFANGNFFDICAWKSFREWNFSKTFRVTLILGLDMSAHSIDGAIGCHKCQVVLRSQYINRADRCSLHHRSVAY